MEVVLDFDLQKGTVIAWENFALLVEDVKESAIGFRKLPKPAAFFGFETGEYRKFSPTLFS